MKLYRSVAGFVIAVLFTAVFAGAAKAQKVDQAKVEQKIDYAALAVALEQTGLIYQKMDADTWIVQTKIGDQDAKMLIKTNQDVVSIVAMLAQTPKQIPDKLLKKLAELNNKYFFIKFVYDPSNIYLRVDTLLYATNGVVLSNYITRLGMTVSGEGAGILEAAGIPQAPAPAPRPKEK